jgi:beta-1,4-mannosyl-glycoprotein beta-1,4-N-acetylglucosaminyltransferase
MTITRSSTSSDDAVTIVTLLKVNESAGWTPDVVRRMLNAITQHLSVPFRFVCVTDAELEFCETRPLIDIIGDRKHCWKSWQKIQIHRAEHGFTGRTLFIDLDMLIVDDFADLIEQCRGHSFLMSNDPWRGDISCSAIMYWEGDHSDIWERFCSKPFEHWIEVYNNAPGHDRVGVEQAFVAASKSHGIIQDVIDSTIRTDRFRRQRTNGEAAILFCSGNRKPWNNLYHPDVIRYWLGRPMIIDTFLFNNEFDMLDLRIDLTKHWVDRWVVCEGNRTLSGLPKPYNLSDNIERYAHLGDRLKVIKLDVPEGWSNWDIENGQRAAIAEGYADCNDDDIVMHSDLDEILDPDRVSDIFLQLERSDRPVSCSLEMYMHRFDQKLNRNWAGNVVAKKRHFQDPCKLYKGVMAGVGTAQKKKDRSHCVWTEGNVGWHWGWMGDEGSIKSKVVSCIETQHRDADQVYDYFSQNRADLAVNHKCATTLVEPNYPEKVLAVIQRYPWWSDRG